MSIRKLAAQAALLQFLFLIALMGTFSYLMNVSGLSMEDMDSPTKAAQMMVNHKSIYALLYGMDWFFAITVFILAAAYTQKFSRKQPWLGIVIGGFGVMSSGLFLAAGTIGIYGIHHAVKDFVDQNGLGLMKAMLIIQGNVEMTAVAAVGVLTFAAALASARTRSFAMWVNIAGYIGGGAAVASLPLTAISPTLGFVWMPGMLGSVLFNLGVAMYFMKKPQPELDFSAQMA